MLTHKRS